MATSIPRFFGGATSATYIGERTEAAPTARPPNTRAVIKITHEVARAVNVQETAKKRATIIRTFFRPYISERTPEPNAPIIAPNKKRAHTPAKLEFVPSEIWLNKWNSSGNNCNIKTKHKTAHGGNETNEIQIQ